MDGYCNFLYTGTHEKNTRYVWRKLAETLSGMVETTTAVVRQDIQPEIPPDEVRDKILKTVSLYNADGMRVLGVAHKTSP